MRVRAEKAEARRAELEKAEQQRAEAQLSEIEKAQKKAAEAEQKATALQGKMKEQSLRSAFSELAAKAGCQDTSLGFLALDKSKVAVDDDGNVTGLEAAIKALQSSNPILFQPSAAPANGGVGNTGGSPYRSKYSAADIKRMTPEEFAKFDRQVRAGKIRLS